jgi:excisionase family DNA binding protein
MTNAEEAHKPMTRYLTYPQARDYLLAIGVPIAEMTLRRWVSQGRIEHTKFGKRVLFEAGSLDRLLAGRTVAPAGSK